MGSSLILCHDSFGESPLCADEKWLNIDCTFDRLAQEGGSIKIDLKTGGMLVERLLELINAQHFEDPRL